MVQHKPDRLLDDFQYLPLKNKENSEKDNVFKFDIDTYINQLVVEGHQIVYSYNKQKEMTKALLKSGIFVKTQYQDETEEEYAQRIEAMKKFGEMDIRERINEDSMTSIGLWAQSHNKPIIMSDIPDYVQRRNISKHESLLEMREMLKQGCMDVILDPNINPQKPYFGAIHRFPDIMFHHSDRYTASLINSVTKRNPEIGTIAVL
jgi:hypothetical protein